MEKSSFSPPHPNSNPTQEPGAASQPLLPQGKPPRSGPTKASREGWDEGIKRPRPFDLSLTPTLSQGEREPESGGSGAPFGAGDALESLPEGAGTGDKAAKAHRRARLKAIRAAIPAAERAADSAAIVERLLQLDELRRACSLFVYVSYSTEVETHGLIQHLLAQGKSLAAPKMVTRTDMLARPLADWGELLPGPMGILAPAEGAAHPGPFDVAVTPGLGFTEAGQRLGFGAGYYDRWFAAHPVGFKVALAFEAQLLEDLPTEATDVPVDAIVTERRVIRVA